MSDTSTTANVSQSPVVIVTGAGSGVGRDTALLMAEAGYVVVLVARTLATLQETADLIHEDVPEAIVKIMPGDVGDADVVKTIVEEIHAEFGRIDAMANVAGYAPLQQIPQIEAEAMQKNFSVNLFGPIYFTAALAPIFRKQKAGAIVNISSMASLDPFKGFQIYAAAKVGLNMFTKCTADELGRVGVKAVAIAPGAIETPMLRENFNEKMIPVENALDPMDVAALVRDCITGARDFENGETIPLPSP